MEAIPGSWIPAIHAGMTMPLSALKANSMFFELNSSSKMSTEHSVFIMNVIALRIFNQWKPLKIQLPPLPASIGIYTSICPFSLKGEGWDEGNLMEFILILFSSPRPSPAGEVIFS
jgi:hypothetical protein